MKKITILALLFCQCLLFAQKDVNQYKYVIIPEKFEFLSAEDKYQVNSLTEFLFNKYGFKTVYKDAPPSDLEQNPCLGLRTNVLDHSGMFVTKLQVVLKDCHDQEIYRTKEGRSRSKQYKVAYHESLRSAFEDIEALNYQYNPDKVSAQNVATTAVATEVVKKKEPETVSTVEPVVQSNEVEKKVAAPAAVATVAVVKTEEKKEQKEVTTTEDVGFKSYSNGNISFFVMKQGEKLIALVNESKNDAYKKGEIIAQFSKTSLPKVYRIKWKNPEGKELSTTGYFDDQGHLNVDIEKDGKIEVQQYRLEN